MIYFYNNLLNNQFFYIDANVKDIKTLDYINGIDENKIFF